MECLRDSIQFSLQVIYNASAERKQAEDELRRAHEELELRVQQRTAELGKVIESSRDIIATLSPDHRYLIFNSAFHDEFKKIFGRDLKPGDSMPQALAHVPNDLAQALKFWGRALAGEDFTVSQEFGDTALDRRWYELHFSPIRDSEGKVIGAVHIVRDITVRKRAEETSNRLAAIVNSSEDAIIGKDLNGVITTWNQGAENIFGYTAAEMVGTSILRLIPADRQQEEHDILEKIRGGGSGEHLETLRQTKEGKLLLISLAVSPIKDAAGKVIGVSKVARDITHRKQAEALLANERTLLRTLVDHLPVSIYLKDSAGRKTLANPLNLRNCGVADEADVIGRTDFDFFPPEQAAAFHADDKRIFDTGQPVLNREEMLTRPDGTTVWNLTSKVPLTDSAGHVFGLAGIGLDITEIRKAEEALRELNRLLETEKVRAESLAVKAEAANRAKSEFLSIMSHELRTPLNGMLGFAQLLSDSLLDSEQKDYADTISKSGNHLLAIVSGILDFSSIEAGTLAIHVAPLAVADLVKTAEDTVRNTAADKGIELCCEVAAGVPEQITGDELRIRQVLINLLGNAVKFTSEGSVVLRVAPVSEGKRRFLDFSVEDTGIGISSETLGRLFQPFVQADSTKTRKFGGTGLGLAISKRIAEAMGGAITVASTPGKGSTFTFRFPLESVPSPVSDRERTKSALSAHRPPAQTDKAPAPPGGHLVLVVDDDQASSVIAGKMLQGLGYRVECAASGDMALKAFVPGKFSAILMDMAMPVMDGLEATGKIREAEAAAKGRVPIIALTANMLPGDREQCRAAGMDDFLTKPFKKDELAAKLAANIQM